ncbi:MAG: ABC transporter substrate-binding protein [Gammaproteobacteria bacterium]|nr:ABC transporter substrate-binding protein [Gammaproteobacteria bacterium]
MRLNIKNTRFKSSALLTFISLLLVSSWSFAYNGPARAPAKTPSYTPTDPSYIIHTTLEKITTFSSNSDKISPVKLRGFIENEIIPHFDFDNMSHWITGRYARNMSAKDKSDFQRNLRETFLSSLSKHLGSFDAENTRVKFLKTRYRGRDESFVGTNIYRPDTLPVRLDFRMRRDGEDWKIIDVKANGSSAVLYYRRHFIAELREFERQSRRPY